MKKQELYKQTIQRWGKEGQIDMFHEEVGELLSALNKYKRGRAPAKDVITEIADVQIMAEQLAEMFGGIAVQHEKMRKLDGTKVNKGSISCKKLKLINTQKTILTERRNSGSIPPRS